MRDCLLRIAPVGFLLGGTILGVINVSEAKVKMGVFALTGIDRLDDAALSPEW